MEVKKVFPDTYKDIDWDTSSWTSDCKHLAYVTKKDGSDWKTIRVMNLETFKHLDNEVIDKVKFSSPSWDNAGKGFFYSRYLDAASAEGTSTQKV
jgi:prolyl oligopeptidase